MLGTIRWFAGSAEGLTRARGHASQGDVLLIGYQDGNRPEVEEEEEASGVCTLQDLQVAYDTSSLKISRSHTSLLVKMGILFLLIL